MTNLGSRGMTGLFMFILVSMSFFCYYYESENVEAAYHQEPVFNNGKAALPQKDVRLAQTDDPIHINSDNDFVTLGFSGSGTLEDPYLIRDLWIESADGIHIENVDSHFTISDCVLWTGHGVWIENANGFIIENNEFLQYVGYMAIEIFGCSDFEIRSNIILPESSVDTSYDLGIEIRESQDGIVDQNVITNCWNAVNLHGNNIAVTNNTLSCYYGDIGIQVMADGNTIYGNEISEFELAAIYLAGSNDNVVSENNCFENQIGAIISGSHRNDITRNTFSENTLLGMQLIEDSSSNIISENWFEDNSVYGIEFFYQPPSPYGTAQNPESNQVFRNVFIDNNNGDQQAYDEAGGNGYGYNYWSDWVTHIDGDNDGFIDDPYPIVGGAAVDPYPLVNQSLASSLTIDSVPLPFPIIRFLQSDILLASIAISWAAILVVPNVKWYFEDKRLKARG